MATQIPPIDVKTPLKTVPKAPLSSYSLNPLVAFSSSSYVKLRNILFETWRFGNYTNLAFPLKRKRTRHAASRRRMLRKTEPLKSTDPISTSLEFSFFFESVLLPPPPWFVMEFCFPILIIAFPPTLGSFLPFVRGTFISSNTRHFWKQ